MTNTEKRLDINWQEVPNQIGSTLNIGTHTTYIESKLNGEERKGIRNLIEFSIHQALAEEKARVGKIIEESHWECPEHGLPKFQKTDCVECNSALEINVVLGALLASLQDTNPK